MTYFQQKNTKETVHDKTDEIRRSLDRAKIPVYGKYFYKWHQNALKVNIDNHNNFLNK